MTKRHIALAALVLVAGLVPVAAASGMAQTEGESHSGTHVAFEHNGSAVIDYRLAGETVASSIEVQSQSAVEGRLGLGFDGDLRAVTALEGAALSMQSSTAASTTLQVESGAAMHAHDNVHGSLVIDAEQSQYVALGIAANGSARAESDQRVLVDGEGNASAAVLVVGEGNVTVNDDGNVTAEVEAESKLVVRSYSGERTEDDEQTERMIVDGTAAAEVYVDQRDGETVNGTVTYDANTSVAVDARSEGSVNVTIDRSEHEGKVVLFSGSEIDANSSESVSVRVDGEAAVRASSYSELRAASADGSTSKYMVRNSASAEADAEVLVAVNHFSERTVSVSDSGEDGSSAGDGSTAEDGTGDGTDGTNESGDDTDTDPDSPGDETTTSGDGPGFGVLAALTTLVGVGGRAVLRRR